jgi:hypothetical protein
VLGGPGRVTPNNVRQPESGGTIGSSMAGMRDRSREVGWTDGLALRWEIASTLLLLQLARPFEPEEVRPSVHVYLAERYFKLAAYHRARGRVARADRAIAHATHHWMVGGPPDLPPVAEMRLGLPRDRRTEARARYIYRKAA